MPKESTNPPLSPDTAPKQDEDQANHTQADHTQADHTQGDHDEEEDIEQDMSIVSESNTIDENVADPLLPNSLNYQPLTTQL